MGSQQASPCQIFNQSPAGRSSQDGDGPDDAGGPEGRLPGQGQSHRGNEIKGLRTCPAPDPAQAALACCSVQDQGDVVYFCSLFLAFILIRFIQASRSTRFVKKNSGFLPVFPPLSPVCPSRGNYIPSFN